MPAKWTRDEEKERRKELRDLYVKQNKSIREISAVLDVAGQTVFQRLIRLGIKTKPYLKEHYLKKRTDVVLPNRHSGIIAEFFGVMLGDGHVSHFQVSVTLGTKEMEYARYVAGVIESVFAVVPKICIGESDHKTVYFGSVAATDWLFRGGLVENKVKSQVGAPRWIFQNKRFIKRFVRGFFDTDGSIYKIRYGIQVSLTNYSLPLLNDLQRMLSILGYTPSEVSSHKIYLTKKEEIYRFFREINPRNQKHRRRFEEFTHASVG